MAERPRHHGISIFEGEDVPAILGIGVCVDVLCGQGCTRALLKILITGVALWLTTPDVDGLDLEVGSVAEKVLTLYLFMTHRVALDLWL